MLARYLASFSYYNYELTFFPSPGSQLNILPGVGNFQNAIDELLSSNTSILNDFSHQYTLGICLGFHLLCESSQESTLSSTKGFGVFPLQVLALRTNPKEKPVHTGWTEVTFTSTEFAHLNGFYYFSHSFGVPWPTEDENALAWYSFNGRKYIAVYKKSFYIGVQFHPEMSGFKGKLFIQSILTRFLGIAN